MLRNELHEQRMKKPEGPKIYQRIYNKEGIKLLETSPSHEKKDLEEEMKIKEEINERNLKALLSGAKVLKRKRDEKFMIK